MSMTPNVALVVDALPGLGGAEKVLMAAAELFPAAPIYTLMYHRPAFVGTPLMHRQVITSFIDRLPLARSHYRKYLPLMPCAIERFDLSGYDVILSFSYAVANGVRTRSNQLHLSYTHTPMRYAWRGFQLDGTRGPANRTLDLLFRPFRDWDTAAAAHVNQFAAVSGWIRDWIHRAYRRDAEVIYPPVDIERFQPQADRDNYYVVLSRLVAHKRVDLIIEGFNRLKLPLVVIGEGPEYLRLLQKASSNVRLLGSQDDETVANLLNRARGFVCATEEDFGIAMVEAQAAGCPVIAYAKGGALETVRENKTGTFFCEQTSECLVEAVQRYERTFHSFDVRDLLSNVQRFSKQRFQQELLEFESGAIQAEAYPATSPSSSGRQAVN
jgi:glycosyltransferase involved in cell wall biosynthesis